MKSIPVLMYHHIADDREVSPAGFEKQLKYLKQNDYCTPTPDEFYAYLIGKKKLNKKSILITFDDGYADNWICAYPLLKKYGFRAVVFITTRNIDKTPQTIRPAMDEGAKSPDTCTDERGESGFLSWKELKVMTGGGVFEVGSHTHTHKNFDKKSDYKNLKKELAVSRDLIKQNLAKAPIAIAWPWGQHKPAYQEIARECGYKMCFTTDGGANTANTNPCSIHRFKVQNENLLWLKSRLYIYRNSLFANAYGSVYGLDRKIKKMIFGNH